MCAHAFGLIERNAKPGGTMNAFCEPPITMSSPHASISRGIVPRPVIASTTKIVRVFCKRLFEGLRPQRFSVRSFENDRLEPERFGHLDPALSEFSGRANDHP